MSFFEDMMGGIRRSTATPKQYQEMQQLGARQQQDAASNSLKAEDQAFSQGMKEQEFGLKANEDVRQDQELEMKQAEAQPKLRQAQLLEEAAATGSLQSAVQYLDEKDPMLSLDVRKKAVDYETSVVDNGKKMADTEEQQTKAAQASMVFSGQVYHTILKQPPEKQAEFFEKIRPELLKHDPRTPETFDPVRAKIAEGFGVSQLEEFKAKEAEKLKKMDLDAKAQEPTTNVEKITFAKRRALDRGDKEVYDKLTTAETQERDDKLKQANITNEYGARRQYLQQRSSMGDISSGKDIIDRSLPLKTTTGDIAAIYQMVKMNDPNAVKEGEIQMTTATYGYKKIKKWWDQVNQGTPLTDDQRAEFKTTADIVWSAKQKSVNTLDNSFRELSKRNGWNPDNVVVEPFQGPRTNPNLESGEGNAAQPNTSDPTGKTSRDDIEMQAQQAIDAGADPKAVLARKAELYKQNGY